MSGTAVNILVIEDDKQIRRFIDTTLSAQSWKVFEAGTLQQGLVEAGTRKPDLVILDLGLPDGSGLDFIREFRCWSSTPIIVLSARTEETDKVTALDSGADDYLTKPFGMAELLARIRANLRRKPSSQEGASVFTFGDVCIEHEKRVVKKAGNAIHLTPIEYRLLTVLTANAGRVMTQRQLLREVWGPTHAEHSHYLRIYMGHLRQKLEDEPAQPKHILTETGVGYRLVQ